MVAKRGFDADRATVAGAVSLLVGALVLFAYPYARLQYESPTLTTIHFLSPLASCLGAVVVVWAAGTIRTGRWRSLTAERAFLAPVLVLIVYAVAAYVPVTPDAGPAWTPPGVADVVGHVLQTDLPLPGSFVAGIALCLGLGVAVARGQRRWIVVVVGLLVLQTLVVAGGQRSSIAWFLGLTFGPLIPGILRAAAGYLAAAPRGAGDGPGGEPSPEGLASD